MLSLLLVTRLATRFLQITLFLFTATTALQNSVLCFSHVGFMSRSQELNLKDSDQKMEVCIFFPCCFIAAGEILLSASVMLQISQALRDRRIIQGFSSSHERLGCILCFHEANVLFSIPLLSLAG